LYDKYIKKLKSCKTYLTRKAEAGGFVAVTLPDVSRWGAGSSPPRRLWMPCRRRLIIGCGNFSRGPQQQAQQGDCVVQAAGGDPVPVQKGLPLAHFGGVFTEPKKRSSVAVDAR
jgi:hypothetical protein